MISQQSIEEIKSRASLVDIIGETVTLKRTGANFTGLCPFHTEKSPSFQVRTADNYYHCFGCGASGNVITYVMHTRGLSFPEAVEELASKCGVTIKHDGSSHVVKKAADRKPFYEANLIAFGYFRDSLREVVGKDVGEYLRSRGLTAAAINEFGVGFAPESWDGLLKLLRAKNIPESVIETSGLVRRSERGKLYDSFRARLIFPIWADLKKDQGRIAGFGGRIIPTLVSDEDGAAQAKYINSAETPVYQKSRILYGLPQAGEAMRKSNEAYLVEGYMDVVGLHQAGVHNAVATCGTAVTENHVKRLSYFVKKVVVLFDGDKAGRSAAARSFLLFLNSGLDEEALFLPEGEDPDSIAKRYGSDTVGYLLAQPRVSLLDCFVADLVEKAGAGGVDDLGAALKGKISQEVGATLSSITNPIERKERIKRAAKLLKVDAELLDHMPGKKRESQKGAIPVSSRGKDGVVESVSMPSNAVDSEESSANPDELYPAPKPIDELGPVDRQLLFAVMAEKESLPEQIMRDPELVYSLDPVTLRFIEGLQAIMQSLGEEGDVVECKEAIREFLGGFGSSWVTHWKQAYKMAESREVNMSKLVSECRTAIKKNKANQVLAGLSDRMAACQDESEKALILQEQIILTRRMNQG